MPYREFLSWRAFYATSPFDDERCFDMPAARVSANAIRAAGGKAKWEDHLPKWVRPAKVIQGTPGNLTPNEMAFLHRHRPEPSE